ncbi:MAG TPA: TolC family protein [Rhodospirillaceae bacterium]|nr:TolC family protein [Rhodospirillaceae bacterium]
MSLAATFGGFLAIFTLLSALPAQAMDHATGGTGVADLDELIAIARQMNPELAMAALEDDAVAARVAGADTLPDPTLVWQAMDIPRSDATGLPARLPRTDKLFVRQQVPLWGKRDLKREMAEADSRKAVILHRLVEIELIARLKTAYADYHQAHQAMDIDRDLLPRLDSIAKLARARYMQGVGRQQEATGAEIERTQLAAELAAVEVTRHKARIRINGLLGRAPETPVAETPRLRPVPADLDLAALTETALRRNPQLLAEDAGIQAAQAGQELAEKGWYPDLGVSLGVVKANGRFDGYEAMLEVNIPLQGGLREAEIGQAKAESGKARTRRRLQELAIGNALAEAYWSLRAARNTERLISETALPQAQIGFDSAVRAYGVGKGEFIMVLSAEQQLRRSQIDLLKAQLDQQMQLAEIEKLAGGDL